jgi:hypothetical protein
LLKSPYTLKNGSNKARKWKSKLESSPTSSTAAGDGAGRAQRGGGSGGRWMRDSRRWRRESRLRSSGGIRPRPQVGRHGAGGRAAWSAMLAQPPGSAPWSGQRDAEAELLALTSFHPFHPFLLSSLNSPQRRRPRLPSHTMEASPPAQPPAQTSSTRLPPGPGSTPASPSPPVDHSSSLPPLNLL